MKYAINHPDEFEMPFYAAMIGLLNAKIISGLTLCIIINICHNATISSTLLAFAAYTQTCNVGVWAVNQAPVGNHLKTPIPVLTIKNRRRHIKHRDCKMHCCRCIYKIYRCWYGAFWYYWLPIITITFPQLALIFSQRPLTKYHNWSKFFTTPDQVLEYQQLS